MGRPGIAHAWRPIAAPLDAASLEVAELRAFETMWRREQSSLREHNAIRQFNERMARRWSIETGIIERLYDVSEGITVQLVEHGFQAGLIPHGEASIPADELVAILNDHREALEFVMDLVGGQRTLTLGWIKEIHALLTRHQPTTEALDTLGRWIEVPLLRGEWKRQPNNPLTKDGLLHEYCPPEQVQSEMERLLDIHATLPHPEVRAAWLHHAFTQIHPFQDGNGRVARALASIDLIKAGLFPMLVRRQERERYIVALRDADRGDLRPLVHYFAEVQQSLLRRAISEAEGALDAGSNLSSVIAAARAKRERRGDAAARDRGVLRIRMGPMLDAAKQAFETTAEQLRREITGIEVRPVQRSDANSHGYFRHQLIQMAKRHDYWADLNEPREWVRMQLRDGGLTDIVVAIHFVGNPSPGLAVAVMFVEHRAIDEALGARAPMSVAAEPLLLSADEVEQAQQHRFLAWLEPALIHALAQWTRYL